MCNVRVGTHIFCHGRRVAPLLLQRPVKTELCNSITPTPVNQHSSCNAINFLMLLTKFLAAMAKPSSARVIHGSELQAP